jgi:hypothetical protein
MTGVLMLGAARRLSAVLRTRRVSRALRWTTGSSRRSVVDVERHFRRRISSGRAARDGSQRTALNASLLAGDLRPSPCLRSPWPNLGARPRNLCNTQVARS